MQQILSNNLYFLQKIKICIYLNHSHHDHEATAKVLHNLYKCKKEMKEFFYNRDPDAPDMIRCMESQFYGFAPTPYDGCNIIFGSLQNSDLTNFSFENVNKLLIMTSEAQLLLNGSYSDSIYIYNFEHVSIRHVLRTSVHAVRNALHFLEDSCCINIKAIHVLNAAPLMRFVYGKKYLISKS